MKLIMIQQKFNNYKNVTKNIFWTKLYSYKFTLILFNFIKFILIQLKLNKYTKRHIKNIS